MHEELGTEIEEFLLRTTLIHTRLPHELHPEEFAELPGALRGELLEGVLQKAIPTDLQVEVGVLALREGELETLLERETLFRSENQSLGEGGEEMRVTTPAEFRELDGGRRLRNPSQVIV